MKRFLLLILTLLSSLIISSLITRFLIYVQLRNNKGQDINEYLTLSHQKKKNTPTCGGIAIILSIVLTSFMNLSLYEDFRYVSSICVLVSFMIIGLIDDLLKIKTSYKGLSASIRFLVEMLISILIFTYLNDNYLLDNSFYLINDIGMDFGMISIIVFALLIVGSSNAMNLTDGLDALAGGMTLIMIFPFVILSVFYKEESILFLLLSIFGSVLGFLIHNINPAKIFMGDSGSLPLGAIFGFIAYLLKCEFLLAVVGGMLVIETISVILQVTSFKIFNKRVFLMTPFHHHLELKGKSETSIVILYYVLGITLSLISVCLELFLL